MQQLITKSVGFVTKSSDFLKQYSLKEVAGIVFWTIIGWLALVIILLAV